MLIDKNHSIIQNIVLIALLIISLLSIEKVNSKSIDKPNLVTVDIYGTNELSVDRVKEKYQAEFNKIAEIMRSSSGMNSLANSKLLADLMGKITSEIKSSGKFSFVKVSPIMYPGDNLIHITIDVVDQKNKHRLQYFLAKPNKKIKDPDHLIASWMEYESIGFSFVCKEKKFPSYTTCPAHHCLFGFEQQPLKKYKKIFNNRVEKDKLLLVDVLRNDRDENKRAAAAFLLAHIRNANELVNILIPSIYDSSEKVRNNVMRVIGITLLKTPNLNVPIDKITNALDFPATTDRNKAMLIVLTLIDKPDYAKFVIHHSSKELLDELKLKQPNNHYLSYAILKKLSKKNYSDHDYKSWEKWLKLH